MTSSDNAASRDRTAGEPSRRTFLKLGAAVAIAPVLPEIAPGPYEVSAPAAEPLTLSALKLRSELARDILVKHFDLDAKSIFLAEVSENHHGLVVVCDCPVKGGLHGCDCQWHPLAGTPMTGGMSVGEEPEWDERTLLEHLQDAIAWTTRSDKLEMTDEEWAHAVDVAGIAPFDPIAWEAHVREDEAEQQAWIGTLAANRTEVGL